MNPIGTFFFIFPFVRCETQSHVGHMNFQPLSNLYMRIGIQHTNVLSTN
jgi:hypothetical protein